jgi:2-haloacid dehalogenase
VASLAGEVPGSVDLVRELHAAGIPQWGLTNWSHELWPNAPRRFGFLDELLDGVVVSGTEGVAKPDPAIFAITAERVGLPAERLVFVDDKQLNVEAARATGMEGIVFTDAETLRRDLRDRGFPV